MHNFFQINNSNCKEITTFNDSMLYSDSYFGVLGLLGHAK